MCLGFREQAARIPHPGFALLAALRVRVKVRLKVWGFRVWGLGLGLRFGGLGLGVWGLGLGVRCLQFGVRAAVGFKLKS